MKTALKSTPGIRTSDASSDFISRTKAAAKTMAKELRAEHKRWNLPLLSWKDGKIVATKP